MICIVLLGQNAFNSIIELKAFLTVLEFHWIEQCDVQYLALWADN